MDLVGLGALNVDIIYEIKRPQLPSEIKLEKGGEVFASAEEFEAIQGWINRVGRFVWQSGGGQAANTSYALALMGFKVGFMGVVGEDKFGDFILETLDGVDTSRIKRRGRTGICLVILDEKGERTLMVFPNANDTLSFEDLDVEYASNTRFLYLSSFAGKLPLKAQIKLVNTVPDSVKVAFDPGALHVGKGMKSILPIISRSQLIFLNEEELRVLTGRSDGKGAKRLLSSGAEIVVLKRGAKGSTVYTEEGFFHVPAERVEVVDATGAGDVYAAGFIASLLKGFDLKLAARIATRLAAISIQGYGREKYPTKDEFDEVLEEVKVG